MAVRKVIVELTNGINCITRRVFLFIYVSRSRYFIISTSHGRIERTNDVFNNPEWRHNLCKLKFKVKREGTSGSRHRMGSEGGHSRGDMAGGTGKRGHGMRDMEEER